MPPCRNRRPPAGRPLVRAVRRNFARRPSSRDRSRLRARRARSRGVLGRRSPRARVDAAVDAGARLAAAAREVVRRRQAQRRASTASTATSAAARRNKAALIWEGEPGDRRTLTYFDLYRQVCAVRQRAQVARRQARRSRRALPAADSRAGHRDARLRAHRRRAQRRVRRLQRRVAARSHQRLRSATLLVTADGGYRRGQIVPLKQMADEALRGHAVDRARRRRPAPARLADSRCTSRKAATTGITA